jgi:hypothetical protein
MSNIRPSNLPIEETDLIGFVHTDRGIDGSAKFNLANVSSALNLDGMATQAPSNVAITGGSITGITDLAVADGGTGASDAAGARTNLGVAIGSDVQAHDADLDSWAGVTRASGFDTFAGTPSSANLAGLVSDETGTGALVFANSPTLVTPALGTPASGVVTNLTGTASININGTVGATTPTTGVFTALTVNDNTTLGSSNSDTVTFNGRVASDLNPATDNTYDLGVTGHEWRNLNIDGTANIDSLVADTADINGGTIDGTAIGATTPSTGAFTTLSSTTGANFATSSGDVGIGTASPDSKLHIKQGNNGTDGGIRTYRSDTSDFNAFYMGGDNVAYYDNRATTGGHDFYLNGSKLAGFSSTGLAVTGALSATTSVTTPSLTNAGTLALSATGANVITASTNGVEQMRIASTGNVGIGTTTPGSKLDVNGELRIGNTVNTVTPTLPNRTITMVIGGTTYYIHAKTTND